MLTAKSADLETFSRFFPFSILFRVLLGWILFIVHCIFNFKYAMVQKGANLEVVCFI